MRHNSGQVGIIILLIVVVMSTIGISVVSRTSSDVSISRSGEDANKALDAAESGVEKALSDSNALDPDSTAQSTGSITTIPGVSVNYTVDKLTSLETVLDEGFSAELNVSSVPSNGSNLNIYWAKETACGQNPASLIITVYKDPGVNPPYRKIYAGACSQTPSDNFTIAGSGSFGYLRLVTIPLETTDLAVRIRSVYNQTMLRVQSSGWSLPVQQYRITSKAQSATGQENKAVQVDRGLPQAPSIFDYTLFAGSSITN